MAPPAEVVELLNALPIHTVDDVRKRFPEVPVEEIRAGGHFSNLRLLTTSTCRMRCGYPGEGVMWCHNEGMERNAIPEADLQRMLGIVEYFRDHHGIREVTLAGLQPRLDDGLIAFIERLRANDIKRVSLVTHGLKLIPWIPRLRDAGLSDVVLSMQGFDRHGYADIMGEDAFDNALRVIDHCRDLGLPVTVNRVLLRGYYEDIPDFLTWAVDRKLRVRLYDVLWMPGQDKHFLANHVSWQAIVHLWARMVERITVWTYGLPGRINVVFHLRGGASVETNVNAPKVQHTAPVCRSCALKDACAEGWLGCGIRITADYKITPCVLRPDLATPVVDGTGGYLRPSVLNPYLAGELHGTAGR
ncbi:radical SAM protein [Streptomyces eurocidicus]|uniref:Molybdenum cofactor biosynthesis enzyme MoaA n=1 Tax=Streptomyces eurocidicus TaxID=66423 RepID=A0A7W8BHM1_STREU|nr:radical SAM protein [Streptomyces eurocidicus]MBB5123087.1 molybdenum cofactor biosynthesis enzyme MoaA [Streptomyces eurocidicus]MBF6056160.1 radical SAM protein [Streptomyces eurocidicus]